MTDHGARTSYLALEPGTPVFDRDGEEIGTLDHVLADPSVDVFDGLIVDTRPLLGGHRFADADQVGDLYERAIFLKVGRDDLHEPSASPAALRANPADAEESELAVRLRRAWDWISGRY